jgi:hypothetical protein
MLLGFDAVHDTEDTGEGGSNWPPPPSFRPLVGTRARQRLFGPLEFEHVPTASNPEAIRITNAWNRGNVVRLDIPQLGAIRRGTRIWVHHLAADQMAALWQAWDDAGLLDRVKTWHGCYVPRLMRGSQTSLSNHAFGTAFDINYKWNRLGHQPALRGEEGSVRELVTIANDHGFYWGGHFRRRADGMHFEMAQLPSG